MRATSRKKVGISRQLSLKQKKAAEFRASGLNNADAARQAGYAESTALNAEVKIFSKPQVQDYLEWVARKVAPPERLVNRLSELIDGHYEKTVTRKKVNRKGKTVDGITVINETGTDPGISLRTIELVKEWPGYEPHKGDEVELSIEQKVEAMTDEELDAAIAREEQQIRLLELSLKPSRPPSDDCDGLGLA